MRVLPSLSLHEDIRFPYLDIVFHVLTSNGDFQCLVMIFEYCCLFEVVSNR